MPAFEYLKYRANTYHDKTVGERDELERAFNELGRAGWELTTALPIADGSIREYWFRRQITPP